MHILLIHQAFAALDEPGGTRHHELARFLVARGHRVTVIASPVSYLTGTPARSPLNASPSEGENVAGGVTVLRAYTYHALHKSFVHRVFAFISFMVSSFFCGLRVKNVDVVWGTSPPIFQGLTAWVLARLKRAKLLFEVRDLWPEFAVAVGVLKNPILIRMALWLERFLYRGADPAAKGAVIDPKKALVLPAYDFVVKAAHLLETVPWWVASRDGTTKYIHHNPNVIAVCGHESGTSMMASAAPRGSSLASSRMA